MVTGIFGMGYESNSVADFEGKEDHNIVGGWRRRGVTMESCHWSSTARNY